MVEGTLIGRIARDRERAEGLAVIRTVTRTTSPSTVVCRASLGPPRPLRAAVAEETISNGEGDDGQSSATGGKGIQADVGKTGAW